MASETKTREVPDKRDVTYLRRKILKWFTKNGREYPWRETDNPFHVLIAEMMLQRTRADQVEPVYREFLDKYGTPEKINAEEQNELNKILEPLGFRWRFKHFKEMSSVLISRFDGAVPDQRNILKQLPGVGQYVSGLVASVAFNKKAWIVDSNAVRIFERFFGLDTKNEARRDTLIENVAKKYIQTTKPRQANLGLVDFGALVCKPQNPECKDCLVKHKCHYYKHHFEEN